ncbi:MAG: hypothetical protein M3Y56_03735, partial [Armatimonadota bacterium]|nr:hypothetical protein [Armatimonadota bacterium]
SWPYRRRSSPQVLAHTVLSLIAEHPRQNGLIVVETGDSSRVDSWVWLNNRDPSEAIAARSHWTPVILQQLLELLTPLVQAARENGYLLCFVSPTPPRTSDGSPMPSLTPAAIWGPGFGPGPLVSRSSPRPGLALLCDLTPTFLHYLTSHPFSSSLQGHPLEWSSEAGGPSTWNFGDVRKVMKEGSYDTVDYEFQRIAGTAVTLVLGCALLWSVVFSGEPLFGIRARVMQFLLLASCAGPAALIIPLSLPSRLLWSRYLLFVALWLLVPLLLFRLRNDLWRLGAACALPALLIALDTVTGGRLFRDVLLSRTPIEGAPLYGLGSIACAVLTGAGLLALGAWVDSAPKKKHVRKWAVVMATALFLILLLPSMGGNLAGALAATAGASLFGCLILRSGKGWKSVLLSILGAVLPILVVFVILPVTLAHVWDRPPIWALVGEDPRKTFRPIIGILLILVVLFVLALRLLLDDGMGLRKRLSALPGLRAALWSLLPTVLCSVLLEEDGIAAAAVLTAYAAFPLVYLHLARRALVGEGAIQTTRLCPNTDS